MDVEQIWAAALGDLRLKMTKATFETWLSRTRAVMLDDNVFTIEVANTAAADWIGERLRNVIEPTISVLAGRPLVLGLEVARSTIPRVTDDQIEQPQMFLEAYYEDVYAEIVRPNLVFVGTQYFRQKWLPILGPVLWLLILELRQRCYWNRETGELRDQCKATYEDLGSAVGVSASTAYRVLNPKRPDRQALVRIFIVNRQVLRRWSNRLGKEVNDGTLWTLRMDEPYHPDDEPVGE